MASGSTYPMYYEIDKKQWIRQDPKKNRNNNGLSVYFRESASSPNAPKFQLERCRTPWGLQDPSESKFQNDRDPNSTRMTLTLSISSDRMKKWGEEVDEDNILWITENCPRIFNREIERSTVEQALYNGTIKPAKKEGFNPLMKIKVNSSGNNATKIKVVSSCGTKYTDGTWRDVVAESEVIPIVEENCLWFANNSCGNTLLASHLLVFSPKEEEEFPFNMSQTMTKATDSEAAASASLGADYNDEYDTNMGDLK